LITCDAGSARGWVSNANSKDSITNCNGTFARKILFYSPRRAIEVFFARRRGSWAFVTDDSGVDTLTVLVVASIGGAFDSIVAIFFSIDAFYGKVGLNLASCNLACISWFASVASWWLFWRVAFVILVVLASLVSAISQSAFVCCCAFSMINLVIALSV